MKTKWWIVAVVIAALILAVAFWTANYNSRLLGEWNGLQQKLAELDTTISSTQCDFADIEKTANDLKSRVDSLKTKMAVALAPPLSTKKKFYFADYLDKTSTALASISVNCKTWSGAEIGKLNQAAQSMRDAQSTCSMVLGAQPSRADIFVATTSTFNKMRQARKKASLPKEDTGSSAGGFVMPADPFVAGYVSRMQSLLRQYKGLRGSLDRFIAYVKTYGAPPPGSDLCSALESAKNARISIRDQMQAQSVPIGWIENHTQAVQCVQNGIDAITALQDGDYSTFHNISQRNTSILASIRSIYGY